MKRRYTYSLLLLVPIILSSCKFKNDDSKEEIKAEDNSFLKVNGQKVNLDKNNKSTLDSLIEEIDYLDYKDELNSIGRKDISNENVELKYIDKNTIYYFNLEDNLTYYKDVLDYSNSNCKYSFLDSETKYMLTNLVSSFKYDYNRGSSIEFNNNLPMDSFTLRTFVKDSNGNKKVEEKCEFNFRQYEIYNRDNYEEKVTKFIDGDEFLVFYKDENKKEVDHVLVKKSPLIKIKVNKDSETGKIDFIGINQVQFYKNIDFALDENNNVISKEDFDNGFLYLTYDNKNGYYDTRNAYTYNPREISYFDFYSLDNLNCIRKGNQGFSLNYFSLDNEEADELKDIFDSLDWISCDESTHLKGNYDMYFSFKNLTIDNLNVYYQIKGNKIVRDFNLFSPSSDALTSYLSNKNLAFLNKIKDKYEDYKSNIVINDDLDLIEDKPNDNIYKVDMNTPRPIVKAKMDKVGNDNFLVSFVDGEISDFGTTFKDNSGEMYYEYFLNTTSFKLDTKVEFKLIKKDFFKKNIRDLDIYLNSLDTSKIKETRVEKGYIGVAPLSLIDIYYTKDEADLKNLVNNLKQEVLFTPGLNAIPTGGYYNKFDYYDDSKNEVYSLYINNGFINIDGKLYRVLDNCSIVNNSCLNTNMFVTYDFTFFAFDKYEKSKGEVKDIDKLEFIPTETVNEETLLGYISLDDNFDLNSDLIKVYEGNIISVIRDKAYYYKIYNNINLTEYFK